MSYFTTLLVVESASLQSMRVRDKRSFDDGRREPASHPPTDLLMSNQRGCARREGWEERDVASYGRRHTGAFLPVHEYGSGPVDRKIGGSGF